MEPDDLSRAQAFLLRNDLWGTRMEPFPGGIAVFAPELPLRHDSNYLLVPSLSAAMTATTLAAEAERIQSAAGLGHRCVLLWEGTVAERLVEGFSSLGWSAHRGAVMALRRPPHRAARAS